MQAALFADIGQRIGNMIVGALAVAGAGVLGYALTLGLLWLAGRLAFDKQLPKQVKRLASVVGGVATALLVGWLLFFGPGGGGLGGGGFGLGWGGDGDGAAKGAGAAATRPEGPARTNPQGDGAGAAAPLQILMLGGERVKGGGENELTYYQVQPEGKAYGFDDLKALVRGRKNAAPPLREIVIIIRPDSVAHNHPAVKRLEDFAKDERLAISYQKPD